MNGKKPSGWLATVKDFRVMLVIILVTLSLAAIFVPFGDRGDTMTNLQFGLDLDGGSWIQLEFQAEVVTIGAGANITAVADRIGTHFDATVVPLDQYHLEIQKRVPEEKLRAAAGAAGVASIHCENGVGTATAETVKRILESKVNSLGTNDVKVSTLTNANGISQYVRVEMAGVDMRTAQEIVGTQGLFEIRVATVGNETAHVLYGDSVISVQNPTQNPGGSDNWGVGFSISNTGAKALQEACVQHGAIINPDAHNLHMYLDGTEIYSAPLSRKLARDIAANPVYNLYAGTGNGDVARQQAQELAIHLHAGALPVQVEIAGSGSTSAVLGDYFKMVCLIAGLGALAAVALMVYLRYRVAEIVLPMIATNTAEIIILLGVAVFIQQLDIAAIAALIAVLGTGIDQLVIITDEVVHEGRVPSPALYLKRLTRALMIIMISAVTMIFAMFPLIMMDLSTLKGFAIISILGILIGALITRPAYGKIVMDIMAK
ncbi:MAG: preprotein translocase subunit SecD [Methanocalculaceae archaeon]|jgi:preprotein translocase subunit SecD|nr:preprotein translocase subunit SecD [Methanocalculaceae archaeon]